MWPEKSFSPSLFLYKSKEGKVINTGCFASLSQQGIIPVDLF